MNRNLGLVGGCRCCGLGLLIAAAGVFGVGCSAVDEEGAAAQEELRAGNLAAGNLAAGNLAAGNLAAGNLAAGNMLSGAPGSRVAIAVADTPMVKADTIVVDILGTVGEKGELAADTVIELTGSGAAGASAYVFSNATRVTDVRTFVEKSVRCLRPSGATVVLQIPEISFSESYPGMFGLATLGMSPADLLRSYGACMGIWFNNKVVVVNATGAMNYNASLVTQQVPAESAYRYPEIQVLFRPDHNGTGPKWLVFLRDEDPSVTAKLARHYLYAMVEPIDRACYEALKARQNPPPDYCAGEHWVRADHKLLPISGQRYHCKRTLKQAAIAKGQSYGPMDASKGADCYWDACTVVGSNCVFSGTAEASTFAVDLALSPLQLLQAIETNAVIREPDGKLVNLQDPPAES